MCAGGGGGSGGSTNQPTYQVGPPPYGQGAYKDVQDPGGNDSHLFIKQRLDGAGRPIAEPLGEDGKPQKSPLAYPERGNPGYVPDLGGA